MALTLFATELWAGVTLSPITGQAWSPGPGLWAAVDGAFVYDAGRARIATAFPTVNLAYNDAFSDRDWQRIEVDVIDDDIMLVARFNRTTKKDYYAAHYQGGFVHLYRVVNNVSAWVGSAPTGAVLASNVFAIECHGTGVLVKWNGVTRISATDPPGQDFGTVGIKCYTPNRFYGHIRVYTDATEVTTFAPTTMAPSTPIPTTPAPTSPPPSTLVPTTPAEPTFPPTTPVPTTPEPTTVVVTTPAPTTAAPTTPAPTTIAPLTPGPITDGILVAMSASYVESEDLLIIRAWAEDVNHRIRTQPFTYLQVCTLTIWGEYERHLTVQAEADPLGTNMVRFVIPQARLLAQQLYLLEIKLQVDPTDYTQDPPVFEIGVAIGPRLFPLPVH